MDELIRSRETVEAEAEEVGDKKEEKEDEKVDGKEAPSRRRERPRQGKSKQQAKK